MKPIIPVILSGGSGTRLWPASREQQPKQLLALTDTASLIRLTVERVAGIEAVAPPIVVTNGSHATAISRELKAAGTTGSTLILEPFGRNTAPAVAVAAHHVVAQEGDGLMLVLPADHVIQDVGAFRTAVALAAVTAQEGRLVTFGIRAASPETGYGYIKAGEPLGAGVFSIAEFKEKPDRETAEEYVTSGNYSWNSGMFMFTASAYLRELANHRPDILEGSEGAYTAAVRTEGELALDRDSFASCPSESIDYAVMEPTDAGVVIPVDPGWSDVGSWSSLWDLGAKDSDGNVVRGDIVTEATSDSYIDGSHRLVATAGVDRLVIVDTPDALLVTTLDASQHVKDVVDSLRHRDRPEAITNGSSVSQWGTSTRIGTGLGHRVDLLVIDPGASVDRTVSANHSVTLRLLEGVARLSSGDTATPAALGQAITVSNDAFTIDNESDKPASILQLTVDTVVSADDATAFLHDFGGPQ